MTDTENKIEYVKSSEEEFNSYLENITERVKKEIPEWHVVIQNTSVPRVASYFHLARHDFSRGKDAEWSIPINTWSFAYIEIAGEEREYYILNRHPLEKHD